MNWIDCKVRMPTAEDGDPVGRVFARTQSGGLNIMLWAVVQSHHVAWMPIPEFTPEPPEPPKGYEILTDYDAEPDPKARYWDEQYKGWFLIGDISIRGSYKKSEIYAVPIKPPEPPEGYEILKDYEAVWHPKTMHWVPRLAGWQYSECHHRREYNQGEFYAVPIDPIDPLEPQYRPFKNAAEFRPFRNRWWRVKSSKYMNPPAAYGESDVALRTWQQAFDQLEFECGHPFGVKTEG